jgi:hypothetical protein
MRKTTKKEERRIEDKQNKCFPVEVSAWALDAEFLTAAKTIWCL